MGLNISLKNRETWALVDANNFFVSCERVFKPILKNKPVVVLSSNDGCCVARSNEVKALGVPMAAPAFKYKDLFKKHNVVQLSSNFELYADMSERIMSILSRYTPDFEVYSIDEGFLRLTDFNLNIKEIENYCRGIREDVMKSTGVPVSIGIATTKTLAKIANKFAKQEELFDGVFNLLALDDSKVKKKLRELPVSDVWGVGIKTSEKYKKNNINNAYDLSKQNANWVKQQTSILGVRTFLELNQIACIELEDTFKARKSIVVSRSFGSSVTSKLELESAIATFFVNATQKLRSQKSLARYLSIYLRSSSQNDSKRRYVKSLGTYLPVASNHAPNFINAGLKLLNSIYMSQVNYKKAGVFIAEISSAGTFQGDVFDRFSYKNNLRKQNLMRTFDAINAKHGKYSIKLGTQGVKPKWSSRREYRTPRYTTNLNEVVQCK